MMSWLAAVVRVIAQVTCGVVMARVSNENGSGGTSPDCTSRAAQSMVRPSRRGGRAGLQPSHGQREPFKRRASPTAGASPTRPPAVCSLADVDAAAQERAGRQRPRRRRVSRPPPPRRTPATRPSAIIRSSTSASSRVEVGCSPSSCLHRRAVERPIRLRPGPAHGRPLAPVQHPELDAGPVGDPAHQAVERIDFAHQMALAQPADGRVAGHRPDGRQPMGDQRPCGRPAARPPPPLRSRRVHPPPRSRQSSGRSEVGSPYARQHPHGLRASA